jgi:hypothetical protein
MESKRTARVIRFIADNLPRAPSGAGRPRRAISILVPEMYIAVAGVDFPAVSTAAREC